MILSVVGAAFVVIALCALLDVRRAAPADGALFVFTQLVLRAATVLGLALAALVYLPSTAPFASVSHWCVHTALPGISEGVGVDGHGVAALVLLVPSGLLALSVLWAVRTIWRGARTVRQALARKVISDGPGRSLIVSGRTPFLAAAGLRQPRVVVSMGALFRLDESELDASLQHEWGHIARGHRFLSVLARLLYALARPLPGSSHLIARLDYCLERDADEYAAARTGDRLALASAICKVAAARPDPALALAGGSDVAMRIRALSEPEHSPPLRGAIVRLGALGGICLAIGLVALIPGELAAGYNQLAGMHDLHPEACSL